MKTGYVAILKRGLLLSAVPALLAFWGCVSVGPDYVRPEREVPAGWNAPLKGGITGDRDEEAMSRWWATLDDRLLTSLVDRAVKGNLDVKKARARIRETRARKGVAQAGFVPTLDASGSASWSRNDDNAETTLYRAGFDAAWELDLFGGVRRSVEAAQGDFNAAEEDRHDILVSLLAEVATNYVDVRAYQVRIVSVESNLAAQAETAQLTRWQYEAGLTDELAVQQARYGLENTRSQIPSLRTGLTGAMNRIAVLLGESPGRIHEELATPAGVPVPPLKVAVSIPAEVLRRRPDIRRAERLLAAQTARIGMATADLYPKLTLGGSIGLEALSFTNLVSSAAKTLSGGPSITFPVFKGGALRRKIEVQSALQEQAAITYEAAVLNALEEVENALTAFAAEQEKGNALRSAKEAAGQAAQMAQQKYEAGLADFLTVLDAQRSLLSFEDQLVQSEGMVTTNLVKLYKALGGGWESLSPEENKSDHNGERR